MTGGHLPLWLQPHHDGSVTYLPVQTPSLGDVVPVLVRVPRAFGLTGLWLRFLRDGEPVIRAAEPVREDDAAVWWQADLHVANPLVSYRFFGRRDDGTVGWLNGTGWHARDVGDSFDFRVVADPSSPDWVADAVVYQVFPDRFARSGKLDDLPDPSWAVPADWDDPVVHQGPVTSHQLFRGDLYGIADHLDHVVDLGADTVYLTPVWPARSNHRYDASTFDRVDPLLGGDEALAYLTDAAHGRGLRVVGDLTTNHTGDAHEWFTDAVQDPGAATADWYYFTEHPHGYASWLDVPSLPKLDHRAAGLRARLVDDDDSVVRRWLRRPYALDGWRIDVANMTGRYGDVDVAHDVARAVRAAMSQVSAQTWLLAEHGHDASGDLLDHGWDGTMAYSAFTRPVWTWLNRPGHGRTYLGIPVEVPTFGGQAVVATMRELTASAPWRARERSANQLGSHDTPRLRTVVGPDGQLVAAALMATVPGVPMLFAGDEIGLEGLDGEHSRTPFPWHRPETWDRTTLDAYRTLLHLRREHTALRRGGLRWLAVSDDALTYVREHPAGDVLVHVARAEHAAVRLPVEALGSIGDLTTLYGSPAMRQDADIVLPWAAGAHVHALGRGRPDN